MRYIADLHIHSLFSRATSKASNLAGLAAWSKVKGINLLGTGDFTHPGWFGQLKDQLVPAEPGFFRLADENVPPALTGVQSASPACRFVLSAEISSIYKRHGKVRKVHNILFVPDLAAAAKISARLAGIGNIESDGRPILGLDSRDLLEILLEEAPGGFLVPAHVWTPWFSLFGSKSGFDSIEECFGDLADHIFALETGLSSDPDMNRHISALDRFSLISNSDCHSPAKLGREANIFDTDFNFHAMRDSLKNPDQGFLGTIEFFPEEGKYHYDGHRKCGICLDPAATRTMNGICSVCGRPLTIGVMHRVMELADRDKPVYPDHAPGFHSIIPLPEVLGEIIGAGPATKGVMAQYAKVIGLFGSEFNIFLHTSVAEISERYSAILGEAISRIRGNRVIRNSGYDGEFGVIKVFEDGELAELRGQSRLFADRRQRGPRKKKVRNDLSLFQPRKTAESAPGRKSDQELNPEQEQAVNCSAARILVKAGPGTGKTHTLIARLTRLLADNQVNPQQVAAITFTNRAAEEMRERLAERSSADAAGLFIGTFHGFCLQWLRRGQPGLMVLGPEDRDLALRKVFPGTDKTVLAGINQEISAYFQQQGTDHVTAAAAPVRRYLDALAQQAVIDLEGVIPAFVQRILGVSHFRQEVCGAIKYLFVDEFQDLNRAQYELVRILAAGARVFAIGDPDQAIYGFRGSSPEFFHKFIHECQAETISLAANYRSAPAILAAAGQVISRNRQQDAGEVIGLVPQSDRQVKIERYHAPTPKAEAEFMVSRIEGLMGGISHFSINSGRADSAGADQRTFSDIAVLYRLSQQAKPLADALAARGIPCQVVDVAPFYMQAGIRSMYYWIIIAADLAGPADYLALLKYGKGVGPAGLAGLERQIAMHEKDFWSAAAAASGLPPVLAERITELGELQRFFKDRVAADGLTQALLETMASLGIDAGHPDPKRLLELAGIFGQDLPAFASHLQKNSQGTVYDERAEAVTLMTMHAAKGLEFPVVFITGLEEGIVPCDFKRYSAAGEDLAESDLAEERRLFYVALTRARDTLVLTSAAGRVIFGKLRSSKHSRFLDEIPAHLLEEVGQQKKKRTKKSMVQLELF